jgi:flagellar biosynthetic protein FliS
MGRVCYLRITFLLKYLDVGLIRRLRADRDQQSLPAVRRIEPHTRTARAARCCSVLYQCACDNVSAADRYNRSADHEGRGHAVNRALDVLAELTGSLNPEIELSERLCDLYVYMQRRLLEAHMEQSSEKLREVLGLLTTLLSAWREIAAPAPLDYSTGVLAQVAAVPAAPAYGRF